MSWQTLKEVWEAGRAGWDEALEASLVHWRQLAGASEKELRAYMKHLGLNDAWDYGWCAYCACCERARHVLPDIQSCKGICPLTVVCSLPGPFHDAQEALNDWVDGEGTFEDWQKAARKVADAIADVIMHRKKKGGAR